jgi:hypothetical protein
LFTRLSVLLLLLVVVVFDEFSFGFWFSFFTVTEAWVFAQVVKEAIQVVADR